MRRGRGRFHLVGEEREQNRFRVSHMYPAQHDNEAEEREQNRFRASQMYPPQHHNRPAHADGQMTAGYPATNPGLSQSVNDHLKELRTMSSVNTDGRNLQNVSSFGNGPLQQRNPQGMEKSVRGQYHRPQLPSGPPSSSVPFRPPVPPPPFHPSLPAPGLPPFHGPRPPVGPGGSGAMFSRPPPPLPPQDSRPGHPQGNVSVVPVQANVEMPPPPSVNTSNAATSISARPPVPQNNFRMARPSDGVAATHPGLGQNPFLSPPPLPSRFPSPDLTAVEKSLSGSDFPTGHSGSSSVPSMSVCSGPLREVDGDSGNTEAQREVNGWLQKKGKWKQEAVVAGSSCRTGETDTLVGKDEKRVTLTMGEAQDSLRSVLHALAAVQGELQQLEEQQGTVDTSAWESSVSRIRQLKEAYLETKQKLDIEQLKHLKQKLDVRRKKRERQKRRRQEEKEAEQQEQFERAQKHAAIDQWREKLRQDDLNRQQMKKMKDIVDKTLSKVRREIREARKMMDTITRLQKLRAIRNDTAEKRGQMFPPSVANHFTEKTDDLIQLLTQQLDTFQKEEDALMLILETENEEAKEKEKEEKRQKEREVRQKEMDEERQSLFGTLELPCPGDPMQPFAQYYLQAQCNLQALQNIRQEWDTFLVPETTTLASRIPDSWVSPEPPSSAVWASVLQTQSS